MASFLPRIQSVLYAVFDVRQGPKVVSQVPENIEVAFDEVSKIIGVPVELQGDYERNYFRFNFCFVFQRDADLTSYEPVVRKISRVLTACELEHRFLSSENAEVVIHPILEQLYEDLNSYSESSIPIDHFNSLQLKIFPFYPNPPPVHDYDVPVPLINLKKRYEANWDLTLREVCRHIDGVNHVACIAVLADCDVDLVRQAVAHLLSYQVIMTIDIFQYSNIYTLRPSIQWLADHPHVKEECGPYVTIPGSSTPSWPTLLHLYSRMRSSKSVFDWMNEHSVQDIHIDVRRFTSFGVIKGFLRRVHRYPYLLEPPQDEPLLNPLDSTVLVPLQPSLALPHPANRKRVGSFSNAISSLATMSSSLPTSISPLLTNARGRASTPVPTETVLNVPLTPTDSINKAEVGTRPRRTSAAQIVLEQVRNRDRRSSIMSGKDVAVLSAAQSSPSELGSSLDPNAATSGNFSGIAVLSSRHSRALNTSETSTRISPNSPNIASLNLNHSPSQPQLRRPRFNHSPSAPVSRSTQTDGQFADPAEISIGNDFLTTGANLGASSASMGAIRASASVVSSSMPPVPPKLAQLLDGEHHTDELGVKFGVGWSILEKWLVILGKGSYASETPDFGRVKIIYR